MRRVLCALLLAASLPALAQDQLSVITRKQPGQRMRNSSGLFDPESNADAFHIDPGETVVLADLAGPGEIQHIWFTIGAIERRYPRTMVFRIYWDGSDIPSVESPLGDFFAAGNGMRANVSTLPIEVTSYGRALNCYWKMPFARKARLTMTNEGAEAIGSCYFYIDWVRLDSLPAETLYFHARYNQEWPVGSLHSLHAPRYQGRRPVCRERHQPPLCGRELVRRVRRPFLYRRRRRAEPRRDGVRGLFLGRLEPASLQQPERGDHDPGMERRGRPDFRVQVAYPGPGHVPQARSKSTSSGEAMSP